MNDNELLEYRIWLISQIINEIMDIDNSAISTWESMSE